MDHVWELVEPTGALYNAQIPIYKHVLCALCGVEGQGVSPFQPEGTTHTMQGFFQREDGREDGDARRFFALWRWQRGEEWTSSNLYETSLKGGTCVRADALVRAIEDIQLVIKRVFGVYSGFDLPKYRVTMTLLLEADKACAKGYINTLIASAEALKRL